MIEATNSEQTLEIPRLVWPESNESVLRRFPLADLGAQLVEAIALRDWDLDWLKVTTWDCGVGADRTRMVWSVESAGSEPPFKVSFGSRETPRLDEVSLPCGPTTAMSIRWDDDSSPATMDVFVGEENDLRTWLRRFRHNEKLDRRRLSTLSYKTGPYGQGDFRNTDDMGRSYAAGVADRQAYGQGEILSAARAFLSNLVTRVLDGQNPRRLDRGRAEDVLRAATARPPMPAPRDMPRLYAMVEPRAAESLADVDRNGDGYLIPSRRLAPLSTRVSSPVMHEGFIYAYPDPGRPRGNVLEGVRSESVAVEIDLRSLDSVYVVDNAAFRDARRATFERIAQETPPRDRMTDLELRACIAATAETLVPYGDYVMGDFEEPVVAIGRHLGHDEARTVRGRTEARVDRSSGEALLVFETVSLDGTRLSHLEGPTNPASFIHRIRAMEKAADLVGSPPLASDELRAMMAAQTARENAFWKRELAR